MAELNSIVRVGIVSSLKESKKQVRVFYPDMNDMVSDWLYVLQRPRESVYTEGAGTGRVQSWMPKVNDRVLVLCPFGWNTNGYVLGAIP